MNFKLKRTCILFELDVNRSNKELKNGKMMKPGKNLKAKEVWF
jgi:hypothetical protein